MSLQTEFFVQRTESFLYKIQGWFRFMVFNATFNNISVISWWSVLLVEETAVPRENHWPVASDWQTSSRNVVSSTPCHEQGLFIHSYEFSFELKSWFDSYWKYFDFLILIVFNTTYSNISAISWRPVLVVAEAGVPGENHRPWASNG